jgi:hypothetical protein
LILLTDVFGFSPTETGVALGQPVSAIKAVLHRARTRLKKAADKQLHTLEEEEQVVTSAASNQRANAELFEAFVRAFREADAKTMFRSYKDLSVCGVTVDRVLLVRGHAWFYFKDPDGNILTVTTPLIKRE